MHSFSVNVFQTDLHYCVSRVRPTFTPEKVAFPIESAMECVMFLTRQSRS